MLQKSLLKNFIQSFTSPNYHEIMKLIKKDKFIAEDANGAEFITLLSKMLNWDRCIREVKNDTDMKKADGVVYDKNNEPIAIIELKSSDKKISNRDIIAQAFRYKNEKTTCRFVIISNFKQLDIYSDSSDICFSVDMTQSDNYTTIYALLSQSSLETSQIARLKKLSKSQDDITKEVYKEYSSFRLKLLNNLIENNKGLSKDNIFECANRLLDRFMFILFAEDRGLIPENSIDAIIRQYENSKEWGDNTPLYNYYKKYFHFIDVGNSNITPNIPKYNGNLFKPDEKLENLIIDDYIIKDDLSHLSSYDFSDDVGVEVLGHIFEQSLNDLEKIKESLLEEHKIVNSRKKDGVFYTPKFITEYIINNTVGKLCSDKREKLKLNIEIKETKKAKEKHIKLLHLYREYLENLKIVDPACGSGAFLTACFGYLLSEHKWIQKELGKADAGLFEYHNIDKQIIENNLFGVDINGASVGIAKLSLWLQTAKRDRPLSNLMNNIKSANSLTADWNELFPEIMANGGFDCVVGNPPYVRQESIKELKPKLKEIYSVFTGTADLFVYFYELAQNILKIGGINGFICSNKFFRAKYGQKLREMILEKTTIKSIVDFNAVKVFEDATVDSAITILQKGYSENSSFQISLNNYDNFFDMAQQDLTKDSFSFVTPDELAIKKKIEKVGTPLKEWDIKINRGILTGFNEAFIIDQSTKDELIKKDSQSAEIIKPLLRGRNLQQYSSSKSNEFLIVSHNNPPINIEKYFAIKEHLNTYYERLKKRGDKGITPYNLRSCAYLNGFSNGKILYPEFSSSSLFSIDNNKSYLLDTSWFIDKGDKFLLACLNSKVIWYYLGFITSSLGSASLRLKKVFMEKLPIPKIPKEQQKPFITLADTIIDSKEKIAKYNKHFESLNAVDKIEIKEEIEKLDILVQESVDEVDRLVYGLYGLSDGEVGIVGSCK